jgi:hypothetical protein
VARTKNRKAPFPKLAERQALVTLRWLHALGKVTSKDIADALRHRDRLVAQIRAKLEALGGEGASFLSIASFRKRVPRTRPKRVSAAGRAAWKAQGRYMAAVRGLPRSARAKVRAVRAESGVSAAIAAAKRLAKK